MVFLRLTCELIVWNVNFERLIVVTQFLFLPELRLFLALIHLFIWEHGLFVRYKRANIFSNSGKFMF